MITIVYVPTNVIDGYKQKISKLFWQD